MKTLFLIFVGVPRTPHGCQNLSVLKPTDSGGPHPPVGSGGFLEACRGRAQLPMVSVGLRIAKNMLLLVSQGKLELTFFCLVRYSETQRSPAVHLASCLNLFGVVSCLPFWGSRAGKCVINEVCKFVNHVVFPSAACWNMCVHSLSLSPLPTSLLYRPR